MLSNSFEKNFLSIYSSLEAIVPISNNCTLHIMLLRRTFLDGKHIIDAHKPKLWQYFISQVYTLLQLKDEVQ